MDRTYTIISADSHVNPPTEFWRDYLPAQYRDRAPRVETTSEGDFIVFEGKRSPVVTLGAMAGKKYEDYRLEGKAGEGRPGGWDPDKRMEDLDLDGVDAEVLYGGGPLNTEDLALRGASYTAYNAWLADFCRGAPGRLFGIAYLPMWDIDVAIEETRRAAKAGLRGVLIPTIPREKPYDDPTYKRFWKVLEELQLPAHIHTGVRAPRFDGANFMVYMVMNKIGMCEPISLFIFSGILDRHPGLKLVAVEGGVSWCAWLVHYMDHIWERHRYWTESPIEQPPSYYFHRQVLATFMDDPPGVRERQLIGVGNIMWSSDYPHAETTWPHSREEIERHFAGVAEEEKYRIVCGNALDLYRIA